MQKHADGPAPVDNCGRRIGNVDLQIEHVLDARKDQAAGKLTYPGVVGIEASRAEADKAVHGAIEALELFGPPADELRRLPAYVITRDH